MIHPLADVKSKNIGAGTFVWQFAIILERAVIGNNCNINCHTFIENDVIIGNNVTVKSGVYVWDGITVKDNVFIGPNVTFTNDRTPRSKNHTKPFQKTIIHEGASLGAGAVIMGGIEIGPFSMIAAGALITKTVPARALMLGSPGKIVGWLNDDGTKMIGENNQYTDSSGVKWRVVNNELIQI